MKLSWPGALRRPKNRVGGGAMPRLRPRRLRSASMVGALALTATLLGGAAVSGAGQAPAAAATQGCGYADNSANNGKYANTICWFDFADFDEATARTAAGQPMQVTLDGGYTAEFTTRITNVAGDAQMSMEKRSTPLETRFAFGTDAYRGVPGLDSLYSEYGADPTAFKGANLSFDNIRVVDSAGNPVSGYSFVAADTEDNVEGESFTWSSDKPLDEIERLAPNGGWGCKNPVGVGTTQISCAGTGAGGSSTAGGKSTSLLVAADTPSNFTTQWQTAARSGVAIGIQTAKVTINKQVASRINSADSFDLAVTSPEGTAVGTASTGTANTATTGAITTLPRTTGASYRLGETATAGSPTLLSNYTASWACVNAAGSDTPLPSGTGTSKQVAPAIGDDITCTITNTAKAATLSIEKHAGTPVDVNKDGLTDVGDTIQYSFTVTNTGDLTMSNIGVTDAKVGSVTCPEPTLAPGASQECTADEPYVITADDLTNGSVDNSATANGTPPGSTTPVTSPPSTTSTPTTTPAPALTMVKSASPSGEGNFTPGQKITYSFLVTNTGNVPLSDITINEGDFTGTGTMSDPTCPEPTLAAGANETCTATYTLTQADVDSGSVTNSATAGGTPPENGGTPPTSPPSEVTVPIPDNPAITVAKTASASKATEAGQQITYSFKVTNTGNVTLRNVTVNEGDFSGTGELSDVVCPEPTLASGAAETCTATYTVTQADIDNGGSITNTATATGTPPNGGTPPVSPPSSSTVTVEQSPSMTVVKSASTDGASYKVGEVVTYSFVVTNTGNVTITDPKIDDSTFSGTGELSPITCPAESATMAPAAQVTCTATYTVTQADVDAGKITNTATVGGTTPDGGNTPPSDPSTVTVPNTAQPSLALVKTSDVAKITTVGQTVTYSFKITNTGNVTQKNVTAKEGKFTGSGKLSEPTCPAAAASLAPGASVTCTATYHVTAADLTSGTLSNTATAAGTDPSGDPTVSVPSTATVKAIAPPAPAALAFTGTDLVGPGIGLALMLLALGGGLMVVRRRRLNGETQDNA